MATSIDAAVLNPFYLFLDPLNISYRTGVPLKAAETLKELIFNRASVPGQTATAPTDPERIHRVAVTFRDVLNAVDINQVALDVGISADQVRSILNLIYNAVTIFLGPFDRTAGTRSNVWATLATPLNTTYVHVQKWPTPVQEHAIALSNASHNLFLNRKGLSPSAMIAIPLADLDIIQREMGTLAQKVANLHTGFGNNARVTQGAMPPAVPTHQNTTNAAQPPLRIMHPPAATKNQVPSLQAQNLAGLSAVNSISDQTNNLTASLNTPAPPPQGQKHNLTPSPGTSPASKKSRTDTNNPPPPLPKFKQHIGPYTLFVLAERPRLATEWPNINYLSESSGPALSDMLYTLWTRMTPQERLPFQRLYDKQFKREKDNPPLHNSSAAFRVAQKKNEVDNIPRCETVLAWRTMLRDSKEKSWARPSDSVIRKKADEMEVAFAAERKIAAALVSAAAAGELADITAPAQVVVPRKDEVENKTEKLHVNKGQGEVIDLTEDDVDEVVEVDRVAVFADDKAQDKAEESAVSIDVEMMN